jgi:acyl-ACP thioesterase
VLISLASRRPVRIPAELAESYGEVCASYDGFRDTAIPEPSDWPVLSEDAFRAVRKDADSNMHVNNISYISWAFEYVPQEIFSSRGAKLIKARYRKECRAGDSVAATTRSPGGNTFLTSFFSADGSGIADIYSEWI